MSQNSYGNSCSSTAPSTTHTFSTEHCAIWSIWYICTATWARAGCGLTLGSQMIKVWHMSSCLCLSSWLRSLEIRALSKNLWVKHRDLTARHKMAFQGATGGKAGTGQGLLSSSDVWPSPQKNTGILLNQAQVVVFFLKITNSLRECLRLSLGSQANLWSTADPVDTNTVFASETEIPEGGTCKICILGADSSWHTNLMQRSFKQNGYSEDTNTHLESCIHPTTSEHKQCLSRGSASVKLCLAHPKGNVLPVNLGKT